LVNFLALLGWTPADQKEIVPLEEMVKQFEFTAVSKSNAVFDPEKLAWMNSEYLRHLPAEHLLKLAEEELKSAGLWKDTFSGAEKERFESSTHLLQTRARSVKDFSVSGRAFFSDEFEYDAEAQKKFWKDARLPELLDEMALRLADSKSFDLAGTEATLRALAEEKGVKAGVLINAARVALTGQAVAPGLFEVMLALGQSRVADRLHRAAAHLRGSAEA